MKKKPEFPALSVTLIGHNEARHLEVLLPTLTWADEIVYVDCESQDGSAELARASGCRVFHRTNRSNLNENKWFAMQQASGEWILYLDPDERVPPALAQEIRQAIAAPGRAVAFQMNRKNFVLGRWLRHGSQYPDRQLRLFKKGRARFPCRHVHERLQVDGLVAQLKNDLLHYPYSSVSQYLKKFDFYTTFEADYLFKQGIRPSPVRHAGYLFWKPVTRFIRRYWLKGGFLDGLPGFLAALFDALGWVVSYFKLWEKHRLS